MAEPSEKQTPRLLIVSPQSVYPPIHGGAVRIYNLLGRLAGDFEVYLLLLSKGTDEPQQREALGRVCRRIFVHHMPTVPSRAPRGLPPEAQELYSPLLAERLRGLVEVHEIDVVVLEYTELGQYAQEVPGARVVLVEHDLSFLSHRRRRSIGMHVRYGRGRRWGWLTEAHDQARRRRYELSVCRRSDQVHVMSERDAEYLLRAAPDLRDKVVVIPNGVDTRSYQPGLPFDERRGLLFVGSFPHLPNLDGIDYFLDRIWDRVLDLVPDATLTIAGARPPERLLALDGQRGLNVVGEVDDLGPLYAGHAALVVPLRAGSGTRLKILEAWASGLPVVSTSIGAEGLVHSAGEELLVADDPAEFAARAADLLLDRGLAEAVSRAARRAAVERYDWETIYRTLRRHLVELTDVVTARSKTELREPNREISIVVDAHFGGEVLDRCIESLQGQRGREGVEIVCLGATPSIEGRYPIRVVERQGTPRQGRDLNRACQSARGSIVVFIDEESTPAIDDWLVQLTEPFYRSRPPAAVQGGILWVSEYNTFPEHRWDFTRDRLCWETGSHDAALDFRNAAIRRDLWQDFPFDDALVFEDRRWQRQLANAGQLVLLCWAATIRLQRNLPFERIVRESFAEGWALAELDMRYSAADALGDALVVLEPEFRTHGKARTLWVLWREREEESLQPLARPWYLLRGGLAARWKRLKDRVARKGLGERLRHDCDSAPR